MENLIGHNGPPNERTRKIRFETVPMPRFPSTAWSVISRAKQIQTDASREGAIAIQDLIERVEWAMQSGETVAHASHLRAQPLDGLQAKSLLVQFAKGDRQTPNPATTAFLRAGGLADRATWFRNDLAFAANPGLPKDPHQFW
jgi:hypothetical protein